MNDLIVQKILDEFMKKSYDEELGGTVIAVEDAKQILCSIYNVEVDKIDIKKQN